MPSKMFLFIAFITLLSFVLVHASSPSLSPRYQVLDAPEPKRLSAGTLSSKLKARAETTAPLFQRKRSFDYAAEDVEEESVFSTTLDVESRWPILALEELDGEFDNIVCTESKIHFNLMSAAAEERFNTEIKGMHDFVVVTSHDGCDLEGDRSAHRVTDVRIDPAHHMGTLDIVPMNWHEAFSTTRVSFSRRHPSEIQKRVATPVKREETPSPTQSFPAAPSDVDGLNSSANAVFNVRHTGLEIYPIDAPLVDNVVPDLPVVVRCKTCAIRGDIRLSQGQFNVGQNATAEEDDDFELDEAIGFFTNSSVELLVKRMFSQIELEFELESEGPLIEFSVPLPTIPLVPFQIAGVLTFGPQIVPNIIISADIEGDVGFSYGFNATVPDDSRIHIKIPEFNESSITGFSDTKFNQIPFSASTTISSMALGISFQPQILLGINTGLDALNVNIDGGIGAFVSMPSLSLNVSHATGVDENCDPVAADSDSGADSGDVGNATHLVPSVELDVGVIASYDVRFMDFNDTRGVAPVLASTAWDLPTACVGFEPEERAKETGKAGSAEGEREADGDNGGGNGAVRVGGEGAGIMLLSSIAFVTVAVGFCGWG